MTKEQFTDAVLAAEKSMYYVAKMIVGDDEDCADAIQNSILHAYSRLSTLKEEKYFKTWLTRILINECYGMIRKNRVSVSYEEYMEREAERDFAGYSEVCMEVQSLEEKYRVPFVLHYVEGYTAKEIGDMLQKSEASIKMRLSRGRKMLQKKLDFV